MSPPRSPTLFPVLLVNFIGMLGYSLIIPILVFLVQKFGGNAFVYGILGATYPAFQLFGAPVLGRWSDRVGRRKVLLVSQIGTFVAWCLFIVSLLLPVEELVGVDSATLGAFSISLPLLLLFAARSLDGLTGGNVSVANAYMSDISDDQNRKANFGKLGSSTSLGFVIGPAAAGLLGATALGELLPVLVAAGVSLTAIVVIYFFLPESHPVEVCDEADDKRWYQKLFGVEHKDCYDQDKKDAASLRDILRLDGVPLLFLMYFITFFGFSFFYSGLPILASETLGWSSGELGVFFAVTSTVMVLTQGPLLSFLSVRFEDRALVIAGAALLGSSFFLLPLAEPFWVFAGGVVLALGNGTMWPSFLSILGRTGPRTLQGALQGYANSMGSMASILGLIGGGTLYASLGPQVFYFAGGLILVNFLLAFWLRHEGERLPQDSNLQPSA
ncbi:MAG: MFS transporter [Bacteroidota bacterium]